MWTRKHTKRYGKSLFCCHECLAPLINMQINRREKEVLWLSFRSLRLFRIFLRVILVNLCICKYLEKVLMTVICCNWFLLVPISLLIREEE